MNNRQVSPSNLDGVIEPETHLFDMELDLDILLDPMIYLRRGECNRISCYIVSVIVYALILAPSLSLCHLAELSDIVLYVQALSFMTSVPYKHPVL